MGVEADACVSVGVWGVGGVVWKRQIVITIDLFCQMPNLWLISTPATSGDAEAPSPASLNPKQVLREAAINRPLSF